MLYKGRTDKGKGCGMCVLGPLLALHLHGFHQFNALGLVSMGTLTATNGSPRNFLNKIKWEMAPDSCSFVFGNDMNTRGQPIPIRLIHLSTCYWMQQSAYVACKLNIADLIGAGEESVESLAEKTNSHAESLYRVMRALESIQIFNEVRQRVFSNTELSHHFRQDHENSCHALFILTGEEHYQVWGELLHQVQTGESAFQRKYGMNIFEYFGANPEVADNFNKAMTEVNRAENVAAGQAYASHLKDVGSVIDIGGGQGGLLVSILAVHDHLKGALFEIPSVASDPRVPESIEKAVGAGRVEVVPGNMFESVPEGHDVYFLKHVLHDWSDEQCRQILSVCRKSMKPNAKLAVLEFVVTPESKCNKWEDLNMMVMAPGGRERTLEEFTALFESSGFKLSRCLPTESLLSIVEAVPRE